MNNLEHGWIVDGIEPADDNCKAIIHCHSCWKQLTEEDDYESKGFGRYICRKCLTEECDVI